MQRGRAQRRASLARWKERIRRQNYYGHWDLFWTARARRSAVQEQALIGRLARTRTPCSCLMCCSPRRYGELSRQEQRALLAVREEAA